MQRETAVEVGRPRASLAEDTRSAAFHADPAHRRDIDGLRAVAILSVLVFHAFPATLPGGYVGVDVFFVISGYLIGGILLQALDSENFNIVGFYARRVKRIFPPLAIVLVVVYAFGWCAMLAGEFKQLGLDIAAGAGFVSNLALWSEAGYFDRAAETKPLLHLWSLGIEEQFYIVWPLLLWLVYHRKRAGERMLLAVVAGSFLAGWYLTISHPLAAFYAPWSRFWELASGTALAHLQRKARLAAGSDMVGHATLPEIQLASFASGRVLGAANLDGEVGKNVQSLLGLGLIGAACVILDKNRSFPGLWAVLPVAGSLLIIRSGPAAWVNRRLLGSASAVAIGLASYAIYLWHWPLLTFLRLWEGGTSAVARGAILLLSVALGWASYKFVESPIRAPGSGKLKVTVLSLVLAAIGSAGIATYWAGGIPSRYPAIIQQITDASFSIRNQAREHECFLFPDEDETRFAPQCAEADSRPLILLWGDSHAGSIYPGLRGVQEKYQFGIAQYTASACPPLVGINSPYRPLCRRINDYVVSQVAALNPEVVFLDANWNFSKHPGWHDAYDLRLLDNTVSALKNAGAKRIVILGSAPFWPENLSRILVRAWQRDPLHRAPPPRLRPDGAPDSIENDRVMRGIAMRLGVEFVSVYDLLCDTEGCLTRLPGLDLEITASDAEHLTPRTAQYVMEKIFERDAFARRRNATLK